MDWSEDLAVGAQDEERAWAFRADMRVTIKEVLNPAALAQIIPELQLSQAGGVWQTGYSKVSDLCLDLFAAPANHEKDAQWQHRSRKL